MSRYDKDRVIGSGTFGNVWLVKTKLSRHSYVLKEIDLKTLSETDRVHALDEVKILSGCFHKHIIRYKEAVLESDKTLSIIMEYAEGGDLHTSILKQKGVPFSDHRIITWFTQICLALQYIHYKNILHRDLKSQNIFLTRNKIVKVGDFGIARILKDPEELAKTAIGTPYYLSPEICQRKPYNHKSDIWALGCILFEMTALEHPFEAPDFLHLVALILKGKRKQLPKHCSSIIQDLVKDLLNLDPDRRPSTEVILKYPYLQPYLSEYMLTHGCKESFLPRLISPKESKSRGYSVSEVFENIRKGNKKRRSSSVSEMNPKETQRNAETTEQVEGIKWKFMRSKRKVPTSKPEVNINKKQGSSNRTSNLKFSVRFDKKEQSVLTVSCDTYTVAPAGTFSSKNNPTKTKNLKLDTDYGYQSSNAYYLTPPSGSNKENSSASKHNKMQKKGQSLIVPEKSKINTNEDEGSAAGYHNNCQHFQCHQCMLDMLWKNRIRCHTEGSVNADEYSRLRKKLTLLYKDNLFETIYQSLLWNWGEIKNIPSPDLLGMMQSLNFEQVQNLPLMMQLVQLDIFLKSK